MILAMVGFYPWCDSWNCIDGRTVFENKVSAFAHIWRRRRPAHLLVYRRR
jgi:hypothetical protein